MTKPVQRLLASSPAILAAAALAGLLLLARVPSLVVRDGSGAERAAFALPGREGFAITYRHSVTRQPCTEVFSRGRGDRIVLTATMFQGSGAGLPFSDEGGTASLRDGRLVLEGLHRSFERVPFAPLPLTQHRLEVDGERLDLLGLIGGSGLAVLGIERRSPAALALAVARRAR